MKLPNIARSRLVAGALISLLVILVLELALSVRRETQTWDEACHIFAGYRYWTRGDFGMNPEHPPLVKLLAAAPLLTLPLHGQERKNLFSKEEDFISATEFVYTNNAEQIMFRARMAASLLTLLLAVLVFAATREMFGTKAGFVALTLFVFEPNILAHGATVTTDIGFSCFLLATVYAFYRYVKAPSRIAVDPRRRGCWAGARDEAFGDSRPAHCCRAGGCRVVAPTTQSRAHSTGTKHWRHRISSRADCHFGGRAWTLVGVV